MNTKLFLRVLNSTTSNKRVDHKHARKFHPPNTTRLTDSSLLEELLLVHSLFCMYLVGFVLHDLSFERFIFIYFYSTPSKFISTARKKKDPVFTCSNCTCFTASSINLVKQTVRKTGGKNVKRREYIGVIRANHECVLLYNVFTVNHTIWNRCTKCML